MPLASAPSSAPAALAPWMPPGPPGRCSVCEQKQQPRSRRPASLRPASVAALSARVDQLEAHGWRGMEEAAPTTLASAVPALVKVTNAARVQLEEV